MTTTAWLTMLPSGQATRQGAETGAGIPLGTIAAMGGMIPGTIAVGVGTTLGMILGTMAMLVGMIPGTTVVRTM